MSDNVVSADARLAKCTQEAAHGHPNLECLSDTL